MQPPKLDGDCRNQLQRGGNTVTEASTARQVDKDMAVYQAQVGEEWDGKGRNMNKTDLKRCFLVFEGLGVADSQVTRKG